MSTKRTCEWCGEEIPTEVGPPFVHRSVPMGPYSLYFCSEKHGNDYESARAAGYYEGERLFYEVRQEETGYAPRGMA